MAYVPNDAGHLGWYAEFRGTDAWTVSKTVCTTAQELAAYADGEREHS